MRRLQRDSHRRREPLGIKRVGKKKKGKLGKEAEKIKGKWNGGSKKTAGSAVVVYMYARGYELGGRRWLCKTMWTFGNFFLVSRLDRIDEADVAVRGN